MLFQLSCMVYPALLLLFFCSMDCKKHNRRRKHGSVKDDNHIYKQMDNGVRICENSLSFNTDESIALLPEINYLKVKAERKTPSEKTMIVSNNTTCPDGYTDIPSRHICPHYFVVNFDPNRIPSMIFEARCSCLNCLNAKGESANKCEKVYVYRYVLYKRVKKRTRDAECYERRMKAFAVGCSCRGYTSESASILRAT